MIIGFLHMYISIITVFLGCQIQPSEKIAWFDFSRQESMVVVDRISKTSFLIQSNFKHPEYVKGIEGEGLRTDGYTTCVKGVLPSVLSKPFTISGWFALETFPTDTAGFFGISDRGEKNSISAVIDQTGKILIGSQQDGHYIFTASKASVERFRWNHLSIITGNDIELWLNGQKILETALTFQTSFSTVVLGKDVRDKKLNDQFPLTHINGIMDEVVIWNGALEGKTIQSLYSKCEFASKPDLSIPAIRFANDRNRPAYHLLPAANWTNETHGLIFHNGKYHIFNQKNGTNVFLGQINWGHFSSPDLLHWTEHKPALSPGMFYDFRGVWSGHVIDDPDGKPAILYSGSDGKEFVVNLATPEDEDLLVWRKFPGNPVVAKGPEHFIRKDMHDPYIWKEGSTYSMIVGYGLRDDRGERGSLLLYTSADLQQWNYVGLFFTGDPEKDDSGVFWEMPVLWKMDDKQILLVNKVPQPGKPAVALYWVGTVRNNQFVPDHKVPHKLELINRLLSPAVNADVNGRTVAIGIIPDETSAEAQLAQGWTHLYSIPRIWTLHGEKIVQKPLPELSGLRGAPVKVANQIFSGSRTLSKGTRQVELKLKVRQVDCKIFGLRVGANDAKTEYTEIHYDFEKSKVVVDLRNSSTNNSIAQDVRESSLPLSTSRELDLHVFVDGSVVEVFINSESFTTRMFPKGGASDAIELFTENGKIEIVEGDVWHLKASAPRTDW
jgi:beta-fructofuranosidase